MTFRLRIANEICNRLTVQPSPEDFNHFPLDARFDLVCIDRAIFLERSLNGNSTCLENQPYCTQEFPRAIRRTLKTPFPAFTVNEAEFELVGEALKWCVPPDHELPWSKWPPVNYIEDVIRTQLTVRVESAILADASLELVARSVPQWARGVIPSADWAQIFKGSPV